MFNLTRKFIASLALLCAASAANAAPITIVDTVTQNEYVGYLGSYSYSHNINDDGFYLGSLISGSIAINLYDDDAYEGLEILIEWIPETAIVEVDGFDFDTGEWTLAGSDWANELGLSASATLNDTGMLDIVISSVTGDFFVGNSVLTVSAVPVPGTVLLLGLGLAGFGIARRRKA